MWGYKLEMLSEEGDKLKIDAFLSSLNKNSASKAVCIEDALYFENKRDITEALLHAKRILKKFATSPIDFGFCKVYLYYYDENTGDSQRYFFGYYDAGINLLKEKEDGALENKLRKEGK